MSQQSPYIYKRPKYFLPWNLLIEYNLGKLVLYAVAWEMLCYCYKSGVYPYPYLFFTSLFTLQLFILHWSVVYYPCCDSFRDTAVIQLYTCSLFQIPFPWLLCNTEQNSVLCSRSFLVIHLKYIRVGFFFSLYF